MELFENIVGNSPVRKRLELLCQNETLPHLLLFCGIGGVGKRLFAESLARNFVKSSFDLHLFSPEGKTGMHSIQAMRRFIDEVNMAPFSSGKKAFIIDDAERMLPTSANALLKTLEEPPKNTLIILVSNAPERLLGTIVSRCQMVRFCPLSEEEVIKVLVDKLKKEEEEARLIAPLSHGSVTKALQLLEQKGESLESSLFTHLAKKRPFHEIANLAKEFQKHLEAKRKAQEATIRSHYTAQLKESTPSQRQLIEQEIEGVLSVSWIQEVNEVLYAIQAFFSDVERLEANLPLHYEGYRSIFQEALTHGRKTPFLRVQKNIQDAKLAIERSGPVQNALETLLLSLN